MSDNSLFIYYFLNANMCPTTTIYFVLLIIICISFGACKHNFRDLIHLNGYGNDNDLEQCAKVFFIMGQFGVVNVLIFLDNSWPFSYKQAEMLKELKDRLERTGVQDTIFFAIVRDSKLSSIVGGGGSFEDNDTEKEAWTHVSPDEAIEISSNANNFMVQPLIKIISPDIFVIEDNDELNIWHELNGSRDQILVIDRCGKLAYQIIIPWSILHFPYVKAAILSTHNDNPCGYCQIYGAQINFKEVLPKISTTLYSIENEKVALTKNNNEMENQLTELSMQSDMERTTEFFNDFTTPSVESTTYSNDLEDKNMQFPGIRIIMRAPHYHINDDATKRHEYLVLKLNDKNFHGHLNDMNVDNLYKPESSKINVNGPIISNIAFEKDESPGFYGEVADYWRDISSDYNFEDVQKENQENINPGILNDNEDISTPGFNDESFTNNIGGVSISAGQEKTSNNKLLAHYSRLLPWLYYILNK